MADYTVSRPGQVNASGSATALFYQKYAGMVLTTFHKANVMGPLTVVQTITNGKSASFPLTGVATADYHTPGVEMTGQALNHNEKVISIDSVLKSDTFIADIDQAMNHFDFASIYAREQGYALAHKYDEALAKVVVLAARGTNPVTGGSAGSALTHADVKTVAATLRAKIVASAQTLDEKNIPMHDRVAVMRPAQYYLLLEDTGGQMNRDYGGQGSISTGQVGPIAGIPIKMSNSFPITNISAITGQNNTNHGDFSKTAACVFQRWAAGTVKLLDLAVERARVARALGDFLVARYAVGHGVLRCECSVEIATP